MFTREEQQQAEQFAAGVGEFVRAAGANPLLSVYGLLDAARVLIQSDTPQQLAHLRLVAAFVTCVTAPPNAAIAQPIDDEDQDIVRH